MMNSAIVTAELGEYDEAESRSKALLSKAQEHGMPWTHPIAMMIRHNIACCSLEQGQYSEAELEFVEVLKDRESQLGPDHHHVAESLLELGRTQLELQSYSEAEKTLQRCLTVYESNSELSDSWRRYLATNMLGRALAGQSEFDQRTEDLLVSGYTGMTDRRAKILGSDKARIDDSHTAIVQFYKRAGNHSKASAWAQQAAEAR